jgi:hypothetical protein
MGPRLEVVNPVLWEIGHVGWFHEYWTLRHAHGRAPLIERGDSLWDSSAVPHATRWQLDLPDRTGTYRYMSDVLTCQEERLAGAVDDGARYFYELAIRHEDMHVEALTYSRQTLAYAAPNGLGDAASSSTTRSGRMRQRWHPSASPAPRSPTPSSQPSSRPVATGPANSGATPAGPGGSAATPSVPSTGSPGAMEYGRSGSIALSTRRRRTPRSSSSTGSRPTPGAAGPAGACRPRPNGKRPRLACRHPMARGSPKAVGAGRGAMPRPRPSGPISTSPLTVRSMSRPAPMVTAPSAAAR